MQKKKRKVSHGGRPGPTEPRRVDNDTPLGLRLITRPKSRTDDVLDNMTPCTMRPLGLRDRSVSKNVRKDISEFRSSGGLRPVVHDIQSLSLPSRGHTSTGKGVANLSRVTARGITRVREGTLRLVGVSTDPTLSISVWSSECRDYTD